MERFRRWILCFSCTLVLATPAMLGIFIWMVVEWIGNQHHTCPLQTWVWVVYCVVVYNFLLGRRLVKCVCRWQEGGAPPLRVRFFQGAIVLFIFVWNCVGLHWASAANCEEAPGLRSSVTAYAAFNITWTLFMWVNMVGLSRILSAMMRAGVLHTSQAAPKGALEENAVHIKADDASLKDNPQCPICLEDYESTVPIVRTKDCGHPFHKHCLKSWLQVNRNCPLCRRDLGIVGRRILVPAVHRGLGLHPGYVAQHDELPT